jgi:hypothetical protein
MPKQKQFQSSGAAKRKVAKIKCDRGSSFTAILPRLSRFFAHAKQSTSDDDRRCCEPEPDLVERNTGPSDDAEDQKGEYNRTSNPKSDRPSIMYNGTRKRGCRLLVLFQLYLECAR